MHKTAAHRSIARRAALEKVAFDPAQLAGIAGIAGGTLGLNSAINNREQSTAARIGKGVIGAGLSYAGAKALTDPTAQGIIRTGTQRGMDFIRRFLSKVKAAEAAGTSVLDRLKEIVGGATTRYSNLEPVVQKLLTTGIGAAAGAGVGSISLGHDREGRHHGYLLGGEKGKSRAIGALAGALAGLHVPRVHKAAEAAYAEGFRKAAEAMGVDPVALYKRAAPWAAIGKMVGKGLGAARSLGGSAARLGQAAGAAAMRTQAGQAVMGAGQRYLGLLRGGNVAQLQSKVQNLRSLAGRSNLDAMTAPSQELVAKAQGVAGRAMRQAGRAEGMLANEQRAVDLARAGTAGGLGAAGLLAMRGGKSEPSPVQGGLLGNQQSQELGRQLAGQHSGPLGASEMMRRGWLNA